MTARRWHGKRAALAALAVLSVVAGCATTGSSDSRPATAQRLEAILEGDHRSPENRARDPYRHPKETLLFFGIRPNMHVVEIWPGAGWYTEVLAPLLRESGKLYEALPQDNPASELLGRQLKAYRDKLAARPDVYDHIEITTLSADGGDIAPPGSIDMILTFRNIHNWMAQDWASRAFGAMYKALKPGGILGVEEHRGRADVEQDARAKSGYVNEEYAVRLIEAQGFRLLAKSEVNANPKDTKDYTQGVWTLPPTYRLGDQDRDKYSAIGESDRFTLKFEKPRS